MNDVVTKNDKSWLKWTNLVGKLSLKAKWPGQNEKLAIDLNWLIWLRALDQFNGRNCNHNCNQTTFNGRRMVDLKVNLKANWSNSQPNIQHTSWKKATVILALGQQRRVFISKSIIEMKYWNWARKKKTNCS